MNNYVILARENNKSPAFYTTFALKCPNFTLRLPETNIFRDFFVCLGEVQPLAPVTLLCFKSGPDLADGGLGPTQP